MVTPAGVTAGVPPSDAGASLVGVHDDKNTDATVTNGGADVEVLAVLGRALKEAHDAATELAASRLGYRRTVSPYRASLRASLRWI